MLLEEILSRNSATFLEFFYEPALILLPVCFIVMVIACFLDENETCVTVIKSIACFFMVLSLFSILTVNENRKEQEFATAVAEDWTFFIDGTEVEIENIYIDEYKIRYDEEKKQVHLFHKRFLGLW